MEKNKQIRIALVALLALMAVGFAVTGSMNGWFGQSEGEKIRSAASTLDGANALADANRSVTVGQSDNMPGANVNALPIPSGPTTTIQYEKDRYDFGTVKEGEVVKYAFKFTNTGKEPLLISNAKGSCGCTVPTWPKEPVAPGASGELVVEFNTKGKPGRQSKRVTVTANTVPTETFIEVAGEVIGKEQPAAKGN
ncbi:MAG: DUF1573 domain-containing protein [Saprospiraceae bacterium]|nr:DUF1573 domain-containing protein [Saprospiraceae bacterium]